MRQPGKCELVSYDALTQMWVELAEKQLVDHENVAIKLMEGASWHPTVPRLLLDPADWFEQGGGI